MRTGLGNVDGGDMMNNLTRLSECLATFVTDIGRWPGVSSGVLDHGDVAGANDYRDVLSEMLKTRFGVVNSQAIFLEHQPRRIGMFAGA